MSALTVSPDNAPLSNVHAPLPLVPSSESPPQVCGWLQPGILPSNDPAENGAALLTLAEPHAASPRPAAGAMAGTPMSFLLSFIVVLPSPTAERKPYFALC
jgi:hypothetical protein